MAAGEVEYMVYRTRYTNCHQDCHEQECDRSHYPAVVPIEISVVDI